MDIWCIAPLRINLAAQNKLHKSLKEDENRIYGIFRAH
jgi:hypothetical protein